jgi:chloramphenicol 3-O-phosphotransferase
MAPLARGRRLWLGAIQALSEEPWLRLGIDAFWTAIDERWMKHGPRAVDGFVWLEDAMIAPGPVGQRLAAGMRAAIAACARKQPAHG